MTKPTVSHFQILERLGAGGMGLVYKAFDSKLRRNVAVKFVSPKLVEEPEARIRLLREARAVAVLNHPNVCTIHEVGEVQSGEDLKLGTSDRLPPGTPFIAMEFIDGQQLDSLAVEEGGLSLDTFLNISLQVAEGLAEAHSNGIVHRDLKPQNVLVTRKGLVKILDFGLAKPLITPDPRSAEAVTIPITHEGELVGTPPYMSPEQATGRPVDSRSDIFSFGVMMYEMLTGERPFQGQSTVEVLAKILGAEPTPLSRTRPDLPKDVERIVYRCLRKNPSNRYEDTRDLVAALKETSSAPTYPLPGVDNASNRRRTMVAILPFDNLGPPEHAYFAAGMAEEIRGRLATVGGLGVISRTSTDHYAGTEKNISQIGKELGVDYVIEGTVRWIQGPSGPSRVRIMPQLIRVTDDTASWSDSYDRVIDDVFEIQSDIATQVIERIGLRLLASEQQLMDVQPTSNVEAYQTYLRAIDPRGISSVVEWDRRTVELLEHATRLDPGFLVAWYRLCRHHSFHYFRYDTTEARLSEAKEALVKVEAINPKNPLTRLARGYYFYYGFREYDLAMEEFAAASEITPNDAEVIRAVAYIDRRRGKIEECIEGLKAALRLDPRNVEGIANLARTYGGLRHFEEANRLWDRAIALEPGNDENIWEKASNVICWKGDLAMSRAIMRSEPGQDPFEHAYGWYNIHTYERDYAKALECAQQMKEEVPKTGALKRYFIAVAEVREKGAATARQSLESAALACEEILEVSPDEAVSHEMLSVLYAFLGRSAAAFQEARIAAELRVKDAFVGPTFLENMAVIYGMTDRHEEAIDLVDHLLAIPYYKPLTVHTLRLDPKWDPLRDHPRFQALLKKSPLFPPLPNIR